LLCDFSVAKDKNKFAEKYHFKRCKFIQCKKVLLIISNYLYFCPAVQIDFLGAFFY